MEIQEKRKLAHEYALASIANLRGSGFVAEKGSIQDAIAKDAWAMADAMEKQELQRTNENPLWKHAPEWAKFRAMSRDGDWFYFDRKPKAGEKDWDMTSAARTPAPWIAFFGDWSKSLHERA